MKYVFFGSPRFADIFLKTLISSGQAPVAVVCNPDKPFGRKRVLTPPQTKITAIENKIPFFQPEKVTQLQTELEKLEPELFIVSAYSQIIPKAIINIPTLATIGIHPSLLPLYRGATPIQSALLSGDKQTGTSIYIIDKKMDHGPIISKAKINIRPDETYLSLEKKLAILGAEEFIEISPKIKEKISLAQEQNHTQATFTKKIETADGQVDIKNDEPKTIYRKIQAFNPSPGVFTYTFPGYEDKRVKLLSARMEGNQLKITTFQPAGKKPIDLK